MRTDRNTLVRVQSQAGAAAGLVLALAAVLVAVAPAGPVAAAGACVDGLVPVARPEGTICIPAIDPGEPGLTTLGQTTTVRETAPGCSYQGSEIPCSNDQGVWFSAQQCYAQRADPQPAAGDPYWEGHDPSEGAIWQCLRPGVTQVWLYFFVATNTTPALVDPAELAHQTLGQMVLAPPSIGTAPQSPARTYVGLDTWLWIDPAQFQPLAQSATAGATTVAVTARPVRVSWDLTDGSSVCASPGRAWSARLGDRATTDCSYRFTDVSTSQPDGVFPVSAHLTYAADWTCSGTCLAPSGTLGEVDGQTATTALTVTERQSVVVQ